jgi:S-DNA-T family DNA segregation ATPase FtsK/SpoIIIE
MTRKKETPLPAKQQLQLNPELWKQILGIALMALGVVTLLLLLPGNQGWLKDSLLGSLNVLVGWGVVLAPLWFFAAGLYLFFDSLNKIPNIGLERPIGGTLLFVALIAFIHLLVARFGAYKDETQVLVNGGGWVGMFVGKLLSSAVSEAGAYIVLVALMLAGIIMLFNVSLAQIGAGVRYLIARLRGEQPYKINTPGAPARTPPISLIPPTSGRRKGDAPPTTMAPPHEPSPTIAPKPTRERPRVVVGRAEPPRPPAPTGPVMPRVIGEEKRSWSLPLTDQVLDAHTEQELSQAEIRDRVKIIEQTLAHFGVPARVVEVSQGPTVTQFGVEPGFVERKGQDGQAKQVKVKVAAIAGLANDLALALAASPIRIEAPIPGRAMVGIEVPNAQKAMVSLRSVIESEVYTKMESRLKIALGQDVAGQAMCADLAAMPHLLIAGATGSGKSVCINAVIACLLMNNTPQELRLLMVDPKMVELVTYNGIPHLVLPVITELDKVVSALQWATSEMDRRYREFSRVGVRNLEGYNVYATERNLEKLPYLVLIIDELADLMMSQPVEVEKLICRLAQMSRATGIHLIIATQRPSVDVVTGLIKANFPARVAFAVTTQVDSRVILDGPGAEKLLGRGDMLVMSSDSSKLTRLQGCWVSDDELRRLVRYWRMAAAPEGSTTIPEPEISAPTLLAPIKQAPLWEEVVEQQKQNENRDELLDQAIEIVKRQERASVSLLQRKLRIGYSRAARLIDLMEEQGIIGPATEGGQGRKVLVREAAGEDEESVERAWEEENE